MKVLVTGAGGMLGRDLVSVLSRKHETVPLDRSGLDITDREGVYRTLAAVRPDIVVNCAAYTRVDEAEEEREKAFLVNGLALQNLATACNDHEIVLCHISTDYVFDGTASRPYTPFDTTSTINVYGESKLAGEMYVRWLMRRFYIIRTSWLYGLHGRNFVKTILRLSRERKEIRVVSDQIGSPTWTVTLSEFVAKVIDSEVFGVHHATDCTRGGISWYDLARETVRLAGSAARIVPVPTREYPTPARRPSYSVLDTFHSEVSTGFRFPDWRESLGRFIHILRNHTDVSSS